MAETCSAVAPLVLQNILMLKLIRQLYDKKMMQLEETLRENISLTMSSGCFRKIFQLATA